jgi:hypothetical protein
VYGNPSSIRLVSSGRARCSAESSTSSAEDVLELLDPADTNDRNDALAALPYPGDSHLSRRRIELDGDPIDLARDLEISSL